MKTKIFLTILIVSAIVGTSHAELLSGSRVLIDFGPSDDINGRATASPDVNGNYWNSWRPLPGGTAHTPPITFPGTIVDTANNATSISLTETNSFDSNGRNNGGLLAPDAGLLGDFAINTATEDYWFESTGGAAIRISGLNPDLTYDFRMFGSRETTSTRITRYTVIDANGSQSADLQTSGSGIGTGGYNGNNDTIVKFTGLVPNRDGVINLDVAIVTGGFAYLAILEIAAKPGLAGNPSPADGEYGIGLNDALSWTAPDGVNSPVYDVYFAANTGILSLVSQGQSGTTYDPGVLSEETDYRWRIDVRDNGITYTGTVWNFSTTSKLPIKAYLCAGQSNMRGRGLESEIPVEIRGPHEDIPAFWKDWTQWDALQIGMGNAGKFGPTFTFGQYMADFSANESIAIIKYAVDGTDLYSRWRPPSSGGTQGDLYTGFVATVHDAMAKLSLRYDAEIAGMIWFQGSSDSGIEVRAMEYEQNLTHFIQDLRAEFHVPHMPFIIGKLKVNPSAMPYGAIVLQAQDNVDKNVSCTVSFPTQDLTFTDSVHYDTNGASASGQRFAAAMQLARFGESMTFPEFDMDVTGIRMGTFYDLKRSNNAYEQLLEINSGSGYLLEAKWSTYISPTKNAAFVVEAHHSAAGDDFTFAYSMDDISYIDMMLITKTEDDDTTQSYWLPNGLEGILYIKAVDNNRSPGDLTPDALFIDTMYIYSEAGCAENLPGDFNRDCYVDLMDFANLAAKWQAPMDIDDLVGLALSWLACNDPAAVLCGIE
jgi:hypothetical protein